MLFFLDFVYVQEILAIDYRCNLILYFLFYSIERTFQLNLDPSGINAGHQPSTPTPVTTSNNVGSTADTSNCGCTSTSTTTTNTVNNGIGVGPGRATVVLPGGMPNIQGLLGSQHNARTIDPYLPCMSRHFIASQAQNTTGANIGQSSNVGNVPTQQSSNQVIFFSFFIYVNFFF